MALTRGIKNAFWLICRGEWREFLVRVRIAIGHVDLKNDLSEAVTDRTHYYADSGGLEFDSLMAHFNITPVDAIVDFGCGKGGVLISLSKYPFKKITGVEISPELAEIARRNLHTLSIGKAFVECCDASEFKDLEEYNYFYFFDPFPCVVMHDVIRNIENSIIKNPRKVTVIYLNPFCKALFEASNVFGKVKELPHSLHKCLVYSNFSEKN